MVLLEYLFLEKNTGAFVGLDHGVMLEMGEPFGLSQSKLTFEIRDK